MTSDVIVAFFKFLRRSVDGKRLLCFQNETSVFKFLWRSVDGPQKAMHENTVFLQVYISREMFVVTSKKTLLFTRRFCLKLAKSCLLYH